MFYKSTKVNYYIKLSLFISFISSCYIISPNDRTLIPESSIKKMRVAWEIQTVCVSPLLSDNGNIYSETTDHNFYTKKVTLTIEPPSNFMVSDIPDDNGHQIRLSWTLSPSEETGSVAWYRIYRSRSEILTEPVLLSRFTSIDSLNSWDAHYTILIDSVAAGIHDYEDCVPLNGVPYYYWLQAVGSAEEPAVAGTVKDQNGNPVEGVLLRLYNADTSVDLYAISDPDGSYAFYDVPPGEYYLVAKRDNYQIFSTTVTVK